MKTRPLKAMMVLTGAAAVLVTGCASGRYERTLGQYTDDKVLIRSVKSALDDQPVYKFPDVKVNTFRNVVQLSGFVASEDQKNAATEIVRRVPGVKEVYNDIHLAPLPPGAAPAQLSRDSNDTNAVAGAVGAPARSRTTETGTETNDVESGAAPVR